MKGAILAALTGLLSNACLAFTADDAVVYTEENTCAVVWIDGGKGWLGLNDEPGGCRERNRQCINISRGQWARGWSDGRPGDISIRAIHRQLEPDPNTFQRLCPVQCSDVLPQGAQEQRPLVQPGL